MTEADTSSVFSRIARREIPAVIVAETDRVIAFNDIAPQARLHVVVTPKAETYRNVVELAAAEPDLLAEMIDVAHRVAREAGESDFRLIFNTGPEAGQTIFHVHAHVLSGDLKENLVAR